jgi:DNA-binding transcriptional LysR family regulator
MQYTRRLHAVWSWLPAFRAVGETEHLPTAARELGVVPSSLSRAVRLLEEELGVALFDRAGNHLTLTEAGRTLLGVVRGAMRQLDEGLDLDGGDALRGVVAAAACPDLAAAIVARAVPRLAEAHPQLRLTIAALRDGDVVAQMLRGDADVAVVTAAPEHEELVVERLGELARSVYGRDTQAVVVAGARGEVPDDGWPPDAPRRIAAWAPDERTALEIARTGALAAVAYDVLAAPLGIHRLAAPPIAPRAVYLVHRRPVARHRRIDAVLDAIRAAAAAVTR